MWWPTIFVHPKLTSADELRFQILLCLEQEKIIDGAMDSTLNELIKKCFGITDDGDVFLVRHALVKNFTLPESWDDLRKYVNSVKSGTKYKRTLKTSALSEMHRAFYSVDDEDDRVDIEGKMRRNAHTSQISQSAQTDESRYSIPQAASILLQAKYKISKYHLYDWIDRGKLPRRFDRTNKRLYLEKRDIAKAAQLLSRQTIMDLLVKERVRNRDSVELKRASEAARKFLQRRLKNGYSYQDILVEEQNK